MFLKRNETFHKHNETKTKRFNLGLYKRSVLISNGMSNFFLLERTKSKL